MLRVEKRKILIAFLVSSPKSRRRWFDSSEPESVFRFTLGSLIKSAKNFPQLTFYFAFITNMKSKFVSLLIWWKSNRMRFERIRDEVEMGKWKKQRRIVCTADRFLLLQRKQCETRVNVLPRPKYFRYVSAAGKKSSNNWDSKLIRKRKALIRKLRRKQVDAHLINCRNFSLSPSPAIHTR